MHFCVPSLAAAVERGSPSPEPGLFRHESPCDLSLGGPLTSGWEGWVLAGARGSEVWLRVASGGRLVCVTDGKWGLCSVLPRVGAPDALALWGENCPLAVGQTKPQGR